MTHSLVLVAKPPAFDPVALVSKLAASRFVPAQLRLVVVSGAGFITYEPYVGAASFRALLAIKRKRDEIEGLTVAIVEMLAANGDVLIRFRDENATEAPPEQEGRAVDVFRSKRVPTHLDFKVRC